jgi:alpha-glucosidase
MFDFGYLDTGWDAESFRALGQRLDERPDPRRWPTHVLSNHDLSRSATRFSRPGDSVEQVLATARAAAVVLLTLPGTAFIYYGEEIGMTDVPVPAELAADPDGRDPYRTPMQWSDTFAAGFTTGRPWLPVADAATLPTVNVAAQQADPSSLLSLYRRLLALRAADSRLTRGDYRSVAADDQVYAFTRGIDSGRLLIAVNFSRDQAAANVESTGAARLVLSTGSRATGVPVLLGDLVLEPGEAVILDLE